MRNKYFVGYYCGLWAGSNMSLVSVCQILDASTGQLKNCQVHLYQSESDCDHFHTLHHQHSPYEHTLEL